MATTHADNTVLFLNPIPKGRNVPLFVYANSGRTQWNNPNIITKNAVATSDRYNRMTFTIENIVVICIQSAHLFDYYKMVLSYSSFTPHTFVDNLTMKELDDLARNIPPLFFPNQTHLLDLYTSSYSLNDLLEIMYYGQVSAFGLYLLFSLLGK